MSNLKKMSAIICPLLFMLMLTACADSKDKDIISDPATEIDTAKESEEKKDIIDEQGIETLKPVLTLDKALEFFNTTFEKDTMNFEAIEFKKDEKESYLYSIEGWDNQYNYQLALDAGTAEIIEQETKIGDGIGNKLDLKAAISPKDAMEAALIGTEKEAVESWELKVDQSNRMIYEVNFLSGRNQTIDALSGDMQ